VTAHSKHIAKELGSDVLGKLLQIFYDRGYLGRSLWNCS